MVRCGIGASAAMASRGAICNGARRAGLLLLAQGLFVLAARRGCENSLGDAYAKSALQNKHSDSQTRGAPLNLLVSYTTLAPADGPVSF